MTWADFLKYSKFIAVFYAAAFIMAMCGIWVAGVGAQFLWTGLVFFGAALAANVALGIYHANHKGAMLMAKNDHLVKQGEAQVITGDGKPGTSLAIGDSGLRADMEDFMRDQVRKQLRHERGY